MIHGNRKYKFEELKKAGDTIDVRPANIYSLKNLLREYSKKHEIAYPKSFEFIDLSDGVVQVKRTA